MFTPEFFLITGLVALGGLVLGVVIGRLTANNRQQVKELAMKLENANKERELAQASVEAAKAEITRAREQLESYRGDVVEHFTGTSTLLRDLTQQYRNVYDHLAKGASDLCPEGSVGFLEGIRAEELPSGAQAEASDPVASDTPGDDSAPAAAEAEAGAYADPDAGGEAEKRSGV